MTPKSLVIAGLTALTLAGCPSNQDYLEEIASINPGMNIAEGILEGDLYLLDVISQPGGGIYLSEKDNKVEKKVTGRYLELIFNNFGPNLHYFDQEVFKYQKIFPDGVEMTFPEREIPSEIYEQIELAVTNNLPLHAYFEGCIITKGPRVLPTDNDFHIYNCDYFNLKQQYN